MIERIQRRRGEDGFTLVELLVVIAILGILAAVVVFAVGGAGDKGQAAACDIDKRTLLTASEAFAAQNDGNYANQDDQGGTAPPLIPPGPTNELVDGGYISEAPTYHYVRAVDGPPKKANVVGVGACA